MLLSATILAHSLLRLLGFLILFRCLCGPECVSIVVQFDTDQNTPNKNIVTFPKCSASHKARNSTHNKRGNAFGLDYCQHHIAQITSIDDMNFR